MAEVLAVATSVIAVLQITDRVTSACKFYIENVKEGSSHLRAVLLEISTLRTIFKNLDFLIARDTSVSTIVGVLAGEDGPIEGCRRAITELENSLPTSFFQTAEKHKSKKRQLKAMVDALAWPLKESKARKLLEVIASYKTTIILAVTIEPMWVITFLLIDRPANIPMAVTRSLKADKLDSQDVKDIKMKTSAMHDLLNDSQRQDVFRWLQHTDPSPLHHRAIKNYEKGTGNWILRNPEWTDWLGAKLRCLWIYGIPGAGKTVLMSHLIEQIEEHVESINKERCVSMYYYCYHGHNQDEAGPFLRWLISQLCRRADLIPSNVNNIYRQGAEPSLVNLLKGLESILDQYDLVYVVVDALDESSPRDDLLSVLRDMVTDLRFGKVQLLASSREYIDIKQIMGEISICVSMSNSFVEEDIRLHVRSIIQSNQKFRRWPQELLQEVEDSLSTGARGMFRWAVCQLDALQWLRCERDIVQNALAHLPKTLFETYDRIFLSIPEDERLFVHHALRWICFNDEVYNNTGIPCAVLLQAVERSIACITSSQRDRFVDEETLQQLCGCLIRIEPRRHHDKDHLEYTIPTVSFAHYTVREYVDSARFSGISRAYFDACIEIFLDLTFLQTQHVESTQQQVIEVLEAGKTAFQVLATDFTVYCVVSAISLLHRWSLDIPRPHTLNNLAFVLLNPSTPHFKILATLAPHIEASIGDFISMPFNNMASAFRIRWILDVTDTNAAVFFYLLLFNLSNSDGFALAHAFLQERESTRLLRSRLTFSDWLSGRVLDGSVIEVLVEYGAKRDEVELILHYGAGLFDPSKILILGVGNLWSASCIAVIEPFLKLGADPCGAEFYITPLQIVVYNCYIEGVQKLLEAGADPNGTGNKDGITFKENSFVGRFLHLHQVRPLNICRQRFWGSSQGLSRNIEDLLLQFGAEADPNGDTIVCHYSRPS